MPIIDPKKKPQFLGILSVAIPAVRDAALDVCLKNKVPEDAVPMVIAMAAANLLTILAGVTMPLAQREADMMMDSLVTTFQSVGLSMQNWPVRSPETSCLRLFEQSEKPAGNA